MLDPLTAISLASSVVQFTDFGIKLIGGSIKLYKTPDGVHADYADLETKIDHARKFAERVMRPFDNTGEPMSRDEEELRELAKSCGLIALDLLSVLHDLKVKKPAGPGRMWESFRKVVEARTPWNKDKIEALSKRLQILQESMFQQVQVMMSERQSQVFLTLKDLADGKLLEMKTKILETLEKVRKEGDAAVADLSDRLFSLAEASREQKTLCILNSLDFETRQSRQNDIPDTEHRTFEWIFHDHHGPLNQHVGFKKWLQSGNDIYWISGKPESGKSVLMSYIANGPCTQELLQPWAGNTRLIIAKYFFWNAGAPMQKSQHGLLQSLLREIFGQCPELVPALCPSRWKRYHEIGGTWTRLEIAEAFRNLSLQQSLNLKFCFFVDGVDEYDGGDHNDIVDVLKNSNASPSVKICLSSRPWNIFIAAFGSNTDQRLLLEDHTKADIERYIINRFGRDEQFISLQSRDSRSSVLVDLIVRNAQGVFLWVRIVVSNLLRGLSNDDSLSDLQRRLESLPTSLTDYYQHMFDNIDDFYREETAEILLICLEGIQPLSLVVLWFYEQERNTPNYALQTESQYLSEADVTGIFERIHKRMNARGQDLLDIEVDLTRHEHLMFTVRFTHRTVKDFLSKPDMLRKLTSWAPQGFDTRVTLCKATLAVVKSTFPLSDDRRRSTLWWKHFCDFFTYAHLLEQDGGILDDVLVDEFQRLLSSFRVLYEIDLPPDRLLVHKLRTYLYWLLGHRVHAFSNESTWPINDTLVPRLYNYNVDMTDFFFDMAVEANLKHYVEHKLATKPQLLNRSFLQRPVLDRALQPAPWTGRTCDVDPEMMHLLLKHGANPNESLVLPWFKSPSHNEVTLYAFTTVWARYLHSLWIKTKDTRKDPAIICTNLEVTKLMIEYDAAVDFRPWRHLQLHEPFGGLRLTLPDVFREVFPPHEVAPLGQLIRKHRPWFARQAYSWLRRTMWLWLYREICMGAALLTWPYPIFFNAFLGVILPLVIIPTILYCLWLVWPLIRLILSGIAPVLLPALILSDWIPIFDVLIGAIAFFSGGILAWSSMSSTKKVD